MSKSTLEATFALQLRALGVPEPEREYMFAKEAMGRRWRFDMAWPDLMVAAEIEGGVWSRGRHTRGAGFVSDCEKYNAAVVLGWRVLRIPTPMVEDGSGAEMVAEMVKKETIGEKFWLCYIHEQHETRWWVGRDVLTSTQPMRENEMQVYGPFDTYEKAWYAQGLIPVWNEEDEKKGYW